MAIYHYFADTLLPNGSKVSIDGLIECADEPALDGDWLAPIRNTIAGLFDAEPDAGSVRIPSLTRIGG
jgi:hypothetical protein